MVCVADNNVSTKFHIKKSLVCLVNVITLLLLIESYGEIRAAFGVKPTS